MCLMLTSTGICMEENIPSRFEIAVLRRHRSWRGRHVAARGPAARIHSLTDKVDDKRFMQSCWSTRSRPIRQHRVAGMRCATVLHDRAIVRPVPVQRGARNSSRSSTLWSTRRFPVRICILVAPLARQLLTTALQGNQKFCIGPITVRKEPKLRATTTLSTR